MENTIYSLSCSWSLPYPLDAIYMEQFPNFDITDCILDFDDFYNRDLIKNTCDKRKKCTLKRCELLQNNNILIKVGSKKLEQRKGKSINKVITCTPYQKKYKFSVLPFSDTWNHIPCETCAHSIYRPPQSYFYTIICNKRKDEFDLRDISYYVQKVKDKIFKCEYYLFENAVSRWWREHTTDYGFCEPKDDYYIPHYKFFIQTNSIIHYSVGQPLSIGFKSISVGQPLSTGFESITDFKAWLEYQFKKHGCEFRERTRWKYKDNDLIFYLVDKYGYPPQIEEELEKEK